MVRPFEYLITTGNSVGGIFHMLTLLCPLFCNWVNWGVDKFYIFGDYLQKKNWFYDNINNKLLLLYPWPMALLLIFFFKIKTICVSQLKLLFLCENGFSQNICTSALFMYAIDSISSRWTVREWIELTAKVIATFYCFSSAFNPHSNIYKYYHKYIRRDAYHCILL